MDKIVNFHKNITKKRIGSALFFLFFACISFFLYETALAPFIIGYEISQFSQPHNHPNYIGIIYFLIPITFLYFAYKTIRHTKTTRKFFIYSSILLGSGYLFSFWGYIFDTRATVTHLFAIPYMFVGSFILTLLWKEIIKKGNYGIAFLLLFPALINFFALLSPNIFTYSLDNFRIPIGEYLNHITNYHFNIFFWDSGGYTEITMNLIGLILAAIFYLIFVKYKLIRIKK